MANADRSGRAEVSDLLRKVDPSDAVLLRMLQPVEAAKANSGSFNRQTILLYGWQAVRRKRRVASEVADCCHLLTQDRADASLAGEQRRCRLARSRVAHEDVRPTLALPRPRRASEEPCP